MLFLLQVKLEKIQLNKIIQMDIGQMPYIHKGKNYMDYKTLSNLFQIGSSILKTKERDNEELNKQSNELKEEILKKIRSILIRDGDMNAEFEQIENRLNNLMMHYFNCVSLGSPVHHLIDLLEEKIGEEQRIIKNLLAFDAIVQIPVKDICKLVVMKEDAVKEAISWISLNELNMERVCIESVEEV